MKAFLQAILIGGVLAVLAVNHVEIMRWLDTHASGANLLQPDMAAIAAANYAATHPDYTSAQSIEGAVISVKEDGVLVMDRNSGRMLYLVGHPEQKRLVASDPVKCVAVESGVFSGDATVHRWVWLPPKPPS